MAFEGIAPGWAAIPKLFFDRVVAPRCWRAASFYRPYIKEERRYKLRREMHGSMLVAGLELWGEFVNFLCFSDGATLALPAHFLPKPT